jgi:hypothetical protein
VVIRLSSIDDPTLLPDEPLITTATLAGSSVGPLVATDERERAARLAHLQQAEADFEPLTFDAAPPTTCLDQIARPKSYVPL